MTELVCVSSAMLLLIGFSGANARLNQNNHDVTWYIPDLYSYKTIDDVSSYSVLYSIYENVSKQNTNTFTITAHRLKYPYT